MAIAPGTRLGPYEIQAPLGAGGMGEVYRAKDTRLDRIVAIKVLAAHLSSSPELKQRMEREARAISALNHPNICHLYDIGSDAGTDYLVMEFLEGETLAERLRKGALPQSEMLKIGIAIAEALGAAHQRGIIHRDLKPGNVMLTKSGAKLMDFGLAKSSGTGDSADAPLLSAARTMTQASPVSPLTHAGMIVGTIQYMAPEQIEGKEADSRSDVFALGAVLYEMVTGARPFEGKSQLSVASAILEKDPESVSIRQPLTPPALEHLITTCLAKDPEQRFQSAHDAKVQLQWIAQSGTRSLPQTAQPKRQDKLAWGIAAALALALVAVGIAWRSSLSSPQVTYFSAPIGFSARDIAVAPNGHTVAIVGHHNSEQHTSLWLYEPGAQDATNVPETSGANFPFWSPDGKSIGFFADGKLKKLELAGGPVQTLCDAPTGRGATWNKDGVILFTPSGLLGVGLYQISASGGTATPIDTPDKSKDEDSHRWPMFLPDGIHYLYSAINLSGRKDRLHSIYVGALNSTEKHFVTKATGNAAYAAPGYLVFYRDQTLFAQPFDSSKFAVTGEPTPLLNDIQFWPRISRAVFGVTDTGLLVAQKTADSGASQLSWFDRKGQEVGLAEKPAIFGNIFLSPDGRFVASDTTDPSSQNTDLWIYDLQNNSGKRLTFDPSIDTVPVWSPDGKRIVFASNRNLKFDLYLKDATGAQEEMAVPQDGQDRFPNDWSHDGKYILYERGQDLWYLTVPELKANQFLKATASLKDGHFSPDGKWVAYASNESGRWEIYVSSFPEGHGKWQVSNGGGDQPKWRGDGKELFYMAPDAKIMAAPVKLGTTFDAGTPVVLFQSTPKEMNATSEKISYDVTPDGQKFLVNTQPKAGTLSMSVVLHWNAKPKN